MKLKNQADRRNYNLRFNIILSFFLKGGSILLSLLIVPLTLNYLSSEDFGLWLTISSIISWLAFFDIGLGNGLRNNLTEALISGDIRLAKEYVSTTYALLSIIMIGFLILFLVSNIWLDWAEILNATKDKKAVLQKVCVVVFSGFCLKLIIDNINIIAIADQKIYITNILNFLVNLSTLGVVYYIVHYTNNHGLFVFSFWYSLIPVLIGLIISCWLYAKQYKSIRPSLSHVKFSHAKKLLNLGLQFFFIQIIVLIIFSTDNLLITRIFGPSEVPGFNIAYKYFSVVSIGFSILIAPFWSAFTEAYLKRDISWIKATMNKLIKIWIVILLVILVMVFAAPMVYHKWVGNKIVISYSTSVGVALFILISCWNNIFTYFLNGISTVRLQLYTSVFIGLINIPIAIILSKTTSLGVASIAFANCICLLLGSIVAPIQYYKIINNKAKGIWIK